MIERLMSRLDRWQRAHRPAAFGYGVVKKFGDDRGSSHAALISYYGFFSLFPLLMVLFTVLGYVLGGNVELQQRVQESALSRIPLLNSVDIAEVHGSGIALAVGVLAALWAGLGATQVAQDAMNQVFDSPDAEAPNFVVKRLRSLATLGVIGIGILASTAVGTLGSALERIGILGQIGLAVATLAVNVVVIVGLFRVLTVSPPALRSLATGAVVGAVGWTLLQYIGGWYVGHLVQQASRTYGVFAVVIGLLSWIFLQARIFLYAAEVASVVELDLWPRGLVAGDPTPADEQALQRLVAASVRV